MSVLIFPSKFKKVERAVKERIAESNPYEPEKWEYWEAECLSDVWVYLFLEKPTIGVIFLEPNEEARAFVKSNAWIRDPRVLVCWVDEETCQEYELTELPTNIFFVQGEQAVKALGLLTEAEFSEGLRLASQVFESAYQ